MYNPDKYLTILFLMSNAIKIDIAVTYIIKHKKRWVINNLISHYVCRNRNMIFAIEICNDNIKKSKK